MNPIYTVKFAKHEGDSYRTVSRIDVVRNTPVGTGRGWKALGFATWEAADRLAGNLRARGMRAAVALPRSLESVDMRRIVGNSPNL